MSIKFGGTMERINTLGPCSLPTGDTEGVNQKGPAGFPAGPRYNPNRLTV